MSDGPGLFWALAMFDLNNSLKAMNGKVANHAYQRLVAPSAAKALACIYRIWILKTIWLGFRHDCNQDQSFGRFSSKFKTTDWPVVQRTYSLAQQVLLNIFSLFEPKTENNFTNNFGHMFFPFRMLKNEIQIQFDSL